MAKFLDLTGKRFGRLEVVKFSKDVKSGKRFRKYWICKCDCGNIKEVRTDSLTQGNAKSCGCLKKEQEEKNLTDKFQFKPKYEVRNRRLYQIWMGMNKRCFNNKDKRYHRYGGRDITICDEWLEYDNFAKWALLNGYSENLSIDRIDNDKNYEPSNCRWVTIKDQCRNRSTNCIVKYKGQEMTLIELSEKVGINYGTLHSRYERGLRGEKLVSTVKHPTENGAKISIEDVKKIRHEYSQGTSIIKLCEEYPMISKISILNIIKRKTWKNI